MDDLELDVRFVGRGITTAASNDSDDCDDDGSADCTSDNCGGTEDSAGVTC
jgi:hypothetical protein